MAKSTKMSDFRKLNLNPENTPTGKNVGASSVGKRNNKSISNRNMKKAKKIDDSFDQSYTKSIPTGIAIFFLVLIILGVIFGCLFTPVFDVQNILVFDGINVSSTEIMSKLDEVTGSNIFRLNIKSLKNQIKEIPYIKDVEIKRQLPDTIDITFEERKPYALIKYLESFIVMDKYGYVLEIKKENDLPELAIIYGLDSSEYVIGKKLEDVVGLKYENITYLIETASNGDFDYDICEVNYSDSERVIIAVKDLDVDINFGEIDRNTLTEKMSYLNGILKKLNGKKGKLDINSNNYLEKTIFTEKY